MKKKVKNTILKLIPIRRYDWNNNCYVYANGTVMDLVCIKCKDFNAQSEGDIERDILALTSFFRLYKDEIKIISINIPTLIIKLWERKLMNIVKKNWKLKIQKWNGYRKTG